MSLFFCVALNVISASAIILLREREKERQTDRQTERDRERDNCFASIVFLQSCEYLVIVSNSVMSHFRPVPCVGLLYVIVGLP